MYERHLAAWPVGTSNQLRRRGRQHTACLNGTQRHGRHHTTASPAWHVGTYNPLRRFGRSLSGVDRHCNGACVRHTVRQKHMPATSRGAEAVPRCRIGCRQTPSRWQDVYRPAIMCAGLHAGRDAARGDGTAACISARLPAID